MVMMIADICRCLCWRWWWWWWWLSMSADVCADGLFSCSTLFERCTPQNPQCRCALTHRYCIASMHHAFVSLCNNGNLHRIPLYSPCVERVMWTRSWVCSQHEQGTQIDSQSRPTLCCGNTSMLLLLLLVWLQEPKWLHFSFNRTLLWNSPGPQAQRRAYFESSYRQECTLCISVRQETNSGCTSSKIE